MGRGGGVKGTPTQRESREKWQTAVMACEVAVHTTGGVLKRAPCISIVKSG